MDPLSTLVLLAIGFIAVRVILDIVPPILREQRKQKEDDQYQEYAAEWRRRAEQVRGSIQLPPNQFRIWPDGAGYWRVSRWNASTNPPGPAKKGEAQSAAQRPENIAAAEYWQTIDRPFHSREQAEEWAREVKNSP
ncbi:MAG: hypothetical protein JWP49_2911 [Phenylobacterium sp.]|jgi:hypothetical protein|nr:hypothetical protein [Phenylobacterium sp.]